MDFNSVYETYFPFWKDLSPADRELLCAHSTAEHFESEQAVHDNMGCSGLFIVKSGRLRLYMLSEVYKEN